MALRGFGGPRSGSERGPDRPAFTFTRQHAVGARGGHYVLSSERRLTSPESMLASSRPNIGVQVAVGHIANEQRLGEACVSVGAADDSPATLSSADVSPQSRPGVQSRSGSSISIELTRWRAS